MGEGVYRGPEEPLVSCRVYAPVGAHRDLLAYLVRRLLENGANSSLRAPVGRRSVGMEELLISPLRLEHHASLPLPAPVWRACRCPQEQCGRRPHGATMREPAAGGPGQHRSARGRPADLAAIPAAFERAERAGWAWRNTDVAQRAAILRAAADALSERTRSLRAAREKAHKTWGDAVSEVREAVDFLRYYADEAQRIMQPLAQPQVHGVPAGGSPGGVTGETNTLTLTARGVWVCISPWNFPLAIFMGQVAAALATGNTVLAKPAEQTPAVALEAVKLMHAAGVPVDALQLLHGAGETVGAALVAQPRVAGVVFTGSTQVARSSSAPWLPGWPHRSAHCRDRRYQRHAGRQRRAAGAGGRCGGAKRLPLRWPALLGTAPLVRAREHCRRRDRHAQGLRRNWRWATPPTWPPTWARSLTARPMTTSSATSSACMQKAKYW